MYIVEKYSFGQFEKRVAKMSNLENAVLQMMKYDKSIDRYGRWEKIMKGEEPNKPVVRRECITWSSVSDYGWVHYQIYKL